MLAKKHRLNLALKENSFIFTKGNAEFFSSNFFLAYLRENDQYLKVACLIPKAIFSKAAHRNYYRRLLYDFLEAEIKKEHFSLNKKSDLVIVAKRHFSDNKLLLSEDFSLLLQKINTATLA